MTAEEARVGTRVKRTADASWVKAWSAGVIVADFGEYVLVAWDVEDRPLQFGLQELLRSGRSYWSIEFPEGRPVCETIGKAGDLHLLELVHESGSGE